MMLRKFPSLLVTSSQQLLIVTKSVTPVKWITYSRTMLDNEEDTKKLNEMKREMLHMYQHAVSSVKPGRLVSRVLQKCDDNNYTINGRNYVLNKNVYIVGFGKAVLDMALKVNEVMGDHIVQGILSVPVGIHQPPEVEEMKQRNIQVREGAAANLPDSSAECTAQEIGNLAESLGDGMILLVLISGGGSALLPAPVPGITVKETAELVHKLQSKGASIQEINSVRKKLCRLKGGKLAVKASPAEVISLILSDVIGDPLDFIASGPTVENKDSSVLPLEIIKKYELQNEIEKNIMQELTKNPNKIDFPHSKVSNILIGNNKTALKAARDVAINREYFAIILSDQISCSVSELSELYSTLCVTLWKGQKNRDYERLEVFLQGIVEKYNFPVDIVEKFQNFASTFHMHDVKGLCIIAGGEPTVQVRKKCGSKGGRSQELALRFSMKMHEMSHEEGCKEDMVCVLMAAGTDGIDGPTDAAGAFGYGEQIHFAIGKGFKPEIFLERSDSYGFYSSLATDLIKIGHTGTNVMDLNILIVKNK